MEEYVGEKIIQDGIYEKLLLEFVEKLISKTKDPVIFDIGANIGNHSLSFARYAKQVCSFEPVPEIFAVLEKNMQQNNLTNVWCVNTALSSEEGEEEIFVFEDNMGATSFDKHDENVTAVTVRKQIGDKWVSENNISQLDFIKIDTEGHEAYVLKGLKHTIQRFQPCVVVEWNDPLTIKRFRDENIIENIFSGYKIYVLGNNFDKAYWKGKPLAKIMRRFVRLFVPKQARLYKFDQEKIYKNIIFIPEKKLHLLPR